MKYTEEVIVDYALSRVKWIDQQKGKRFVLGIMGMCVIVGFVAVIQMIQTKSEKVGANLILNENFLAGVAMGILTVLTLVFGVLAFVRMFSSFYGKEIEVYRLLVKLNNGRHG